MSIALTVLYARRGQATVVTALSFISINFLNLALGIIFVSARRSFWTGS
jgi:hypothetical protein